MGSIPANSDAQNVPSFRRWRFEMKLSPHSKRISEAGRSEMAAASLIAASQEASLMAAEREPESLVPAQWAAKGVEKTGAEPAGPQAGSEPIVSVHNQVSGP